jgi:hypothetical protein
MKGWLRGWSPYKKDPNDRISIDRDVAKQILLQADSAVSPHICPLLLNMPSPGFRNFQLVVNLRTHLNKSDCIRFAQVFNRN